jgi:hypothetical protein
MSEPQKRPAGKDPRWEAEEKRRLDKARGRTRDRRSVLKNAEKK